MNYDFLGIKNLDTQIATLSGILTREYAPTCNSCKDLRDVNDFGSSSIEFDFRLSISSEDNKPKES